MGFLDNKIGPRFEVKKRPKLTIVFGLFYPIFGPKKGVYMGVVATELAFLAQIHTMSVAQRRFLVGVATIWIWVYSTSILFLAIL